MSLEELKALIDTIPGQPDGIEDDSRDLPDPHRAGERIREYISEFGDGLYDVAGGKPLYGRDMEAVVRALAAVEQDRDKLSEELARATLELEVKTAALQKIHDRACAAGAASIVTLADTALRIEVWDGVMPFGGFVCAICRKPAGSEPCAEHSGQEAGQRTDPAELQQHIFDRQQ